MGNRQANNPVKLGVSNFMKYKIVAAVLVVFLAIVPAAQPAVLAQDVGQPKFGTWEAVKGIPLGEKVEINLKSLRTIKGEISSVSDTGITVGRDSKAVTTGREEVRRVRHAVGKSSRKPVLTGALIGAGIGAGGIAIAAAADDTGGTDGELAGVLVGVTLAGAGVGALIGSIFRKKTKLVLIYEFL